MIKTICGLYDTEVKCYFSLTFVDRETQFIRDIKMVINSGKSDIPVVKYPEQFVVYRLGYFDDENATFKSDVKVLAQAVALKDNANE